MENKRGTDLKKKDRNSIGCIYFTYPIHILYPASIPLVFHVITTPKCSLPFHYNECDFQASKKCVNIIQITFYSNLSEVIHTVALGDCRFETNKGEKIMADLDFFFYFFFCASLNPSVLQNVGTIHF